MRCSISMVKCKESCILIGWQVDWNLLTNLQVWTCRKVGLSGEIWEFSDEIQAILNFDWLRRRLEFSATRQVRTCRNRQNSFRKHSAAAECLPETFCNFRMLHRPRNWTLEKWNLQKRKMKWNVMKLNGMKWNEKVAKNVAFLIKYEMFLTCVAKMKSYYRWVPLGGLLWLGSLGWAPWGGLLGVGSLDVLLAE